MSKSLVLTMAGFFIFAIIALGAFAPVTTADETQERLFKAFQQEPSFGEEIFFEEPELEFEFPFFNPFLNPFVNPVVNPFLFAQPTFSPVIVPRPVFVPFGGVGFADD